MSREQYLRPVILSYRLLYAHLQVPLHYTLCKSAIYFNIGMLLRDTGGISADFLQQTSPVKLSKQDDIMSEQGINVKFCLLFQSIKDSKNKQLN